MRRFHALPDEAREIVFYAESGNFWGFFEQIIDSLTKDHGHRICYLTSSPDDPVLTLDHDRITPFFIGDGTVRTILFSVLKVRVMVMTMPDLETFHIKRSKHPVHYVFVPHNMLSTHMVFRKGAFDHFESFLCVGRHHKDELEEAERLYGLRSRKLVEHGYGRLDKILAESRNWMQPASDGMKRILIAPSWGPQGLLETGAEELVASLLDAGYQVTVRPHPDTRRLAGNKLDELFARFGENPRFIGEENISSLESFYRSDIMISDWSGAALEFAFGLERPVVFVDVPRKVNNPDYEKYKCEPIEIALRDKIGAVLHPERLSEAPKIVGRLIAERKDLAGNIRALRDRYVYNVGGSGVVGAEYIHSLVQG